VLFAGRELIALSIFRVFEPAPRSKSHSDSVGSACPRGVRERIRIAPRDDCRILVALWTVGVTASSPL
jgi:hypothetical protein